MSTLTLEIPGETLMAICNTSPLQYLHQIGHLHLLPLPWIHRKDPVSAPALPLAADLGPGESAVLALALETPAPR